MIKPITAVKTQHVPQFGGIFAKEHHAEPGAQKVVHKGVTAYVDGDDLELLNKYRNDDTQSSPKRSAARSFLDHIVAVVTGRHDQNSQDWEEMRTGDVFLPGGVH